jgi:hypothetical protein
VVWYLDTSAFLKLVVAETESAALRDWYVAHAPAWSSQLLLTEARRAGRRLGVPADLIEAALDTVALVAPGAATFRRAGDLLPATLRSLDAVHLATALELGADLAGMVAYDDRLAAAAAAHEVTVVAPR